MRRDGLGKATRMKGCTSIPFFLHVAEKSAVYRPTAHIVKQNPYFNTTLGSSHQLVTNLAAEVVVAEDEILHVYKVAGLTKVVDEVGKFFHDL